MCVDNNQLDADGEKPFFELVKILGGWNLIEKGYDSDNEKNWQEIYEKFLDRGLFSDYIMSMYLTPNPKNASVYIIKMIPPEIEDFNRGYYDFLPRGLNNSLVKAYYDYMKESMVLLGLSDEDAAVKMLEVLEFEQKLFDVSFRLSFFRFVLMICFLS